MNLSIESGEEIIENIINTSKVKFGNITQESLKEYSKLETIK